MFNSIFRCVNARRENFRLDFSLCNYLRERSNSVDENFNPFDSLVKEIMGNIRYLDSLLTKTRIILGTVGIVLVIGGLFVVVRFL
jgi:hypothetical protein